MCAGVDVQLTLAGIGVPIRAAHRLGQGHALRGTHAAPSLSLTQSSKSTLPTAVWRRGFITMATRTHNPLARPACPPLTTGSSASHPDLPSKGAGCGFQLTRAAICDTITATHRVIDSRTRLLAHTLGFPVLHSTRCPKWALHPKARGQGLVWGEHGHSVSSTCPPRLRHKAPSSTQQTLSQRVDSRGKVGQEKGRNAQDAAEKGTDTRQTRTGTQTQTASAPRMSAGRGRPQDTGNS